MFSIFYLSVFQLVASELFPAAFDGEPLADPNFGAFFYNPTNFAVHYALEAKNEAVNAVQAATSTSRGLQDSAAAAMEMCSSWESLGNIVGRPEISNGVYCQVGPKAAEGNEWKKCVDGTTKPAPPAITYTGLCPGSWSAPSKDRSLKGSPADVINQCSSWKSLRNIVGRPEISNGVYCQVGPKAAEGNEWKVCDDGSTKPEDGALTVTGLCPGSWSARSLGDSPVDQCKSWESIGHIAGRIPVVPKGVFCQVGIKAAEGNEWKQCVDGTTEPVSPGIMYTGVCPGSITDDDIAAFVAAKDRSLYGINSGMGVMYDPRDEERQLRRFFRSLQDTPDAAINQCSSWKSLGNIVGPPGFSSHGVFCQVGPKAAEGNEWKECVDGTTKPAPPAIMYTGLCPGTMPEVGDIHI